MNKTKICIISSEILDSSKIGGFGSMAKQLALHLSNMNFDIVISIPKKKKQQHIENAANFAILRISPTQMLRKETYRKINADIYHSQNPNLMTLMALIAEPNKKHVVTCRDPRNFEDWVIEFFNSTWRRKLETPLSYIFEESPLVRLAIRKADVVGVPAYFLKNKIKKMYKLSREPILLPNIEDITKNIPKKAKKPIVCFVGRLDKRKRPEIFFELAGKFPDVQFIAVGSAEERTRQKKLEGMAAKYRNVKMHGFIDKFSSKKFYEIYNTSWILVNTSPREGLPLTFVEAAGRGCAILSYVNPDNFASKFGFWAKNENFEEGLRFLLKNNNWRKLGERGHDYVYKLYRKDKAIAAHINLYKNLLKIKNENTNA